jgi:FkbM family methyltransferase
MKYPREMHLPYPQPWEWIKDNISFEDEDLFYVDIGANDGITVSNTAYFDMDMGWKGICIEPHPTAFKKLQQSRPNSTNLNICISDEDGVVDFLSIDGYSEMLSGIQKHYHPNHIDRINREISQKGGTKQTLKITSKSLKNVLNEHNVEKVDYLSIDTEGSEYEILNSIDFDSVDIRVISTENSSKKDIRGFLDSKGYTLATICCGDEIYYRR